MQVGADEVRGDLIARGPLAEDLDADLAVARDRVVGDHVERGVDDEHAVELVGQGGRAGRVGADGVADDAVEVLRQALRINESLPEVHSSPSAALAARGCLVEAVASCQTALRPCPEYAEAWNNPGVAPAERG